MNPDPTIYTETYHNIHNYKLIYGTGSKRGSYIIVFLKIGLAFVQTLSNNIRTNQHWSALDPLLSVAPNISPILLISIDS